MTGIAPFHEFYGAVHGRDPLPWQSRLADEVVDAAWPSEIGIPTGLGKTSVIDIAVWALAAQASRSPDRRTAPTRIWYVVDRRLLVDTASDHAASMASLLAAAVSPGSAAHEASRSSAIASVAHALLGVAAVHRSGTPLVVSRLRGGSPLGHRAPDPSQPAILCATVAMYASRLLFRGFGSSSRMWPIDAAHAGIDSLVLLDEAHLAPALQSLMAKLPACDANASGVLRPPGCHEQTAGPASLLPAPRSRALLVSMTATGSDGSRFDLDETDLAHPVVRKRLGAAKPTRFVECSVRKLADSLASCAIEKAGGDPAPSIVVFVNRPSTARAVASAVSNAARRQKVEIDGPLVLTGQLRDLDADRVRERLLDPVLGAPAGRSLSPRERPLVVVATQTLEVGADLDFDHCVSESAGARALIQRWGRLNRLGDRSHATGVICHPTDLSAEQDPLYGAERMDLAGRLAAAGPSGLLDLSPSSIGSVIGPPDDQPAEAGELLPAHLWEFAKTSLPPRGAAPPEVFFAPDDSALRVQFGWRVVLPPPGAPLVPPVSDAELVEVSIGEARSFLSEATEAWRLVDDGSSLEAVDSSTLRPGDRVILPAAAGGYGDSGWDPAVTAAVLDHSPMIRRRLFLRRDAIENLFGRGLTGEEAALVDRLVFDIDDGPDPAVDGEVARLLGEMWSAEGVASATSHAHGLGALLGARVERIGVELDPVLAWDPEPGIPAVTVGVDALDELSIGPSVSLLDHLEGVGELAEGLALHLGLPEVVAVALRDAGRFHDLGKGDERFQRWLGADERLLAKSAVPRQRWERARVASGWPRGGRHELLSVQLLDAAVDGGFEVESFDLVRHLVISHHGHGRPSCPSVGDSTGVLTEIEHPDGPFRAVTDPGLDDWAQPERFRAACETYGYWGLALLEAIVRQADHLLSAATEVQ